MLKKLVQISIVTTLALGAAEITLDTVTVEDTIDTLTLKNVSGEELKSADLGEALSKSVPSITISRRSGIANDIILRGQKRDNINVIIDGGKIYGGCPNRMDAPISHVVTNNIDYITVNEGPYDVENFGTLSGVVNVHTKAPKEGFAGELNLNVGSFGYKKGSFTIEGGNEKVKGLLSFSKEQSEQYKDGDGDKFQEQLIKAGAPTMNLYQKKYEDLDAYEKSSFLAKLYLNLTQNQELKLSYTANRSDDILYPNSPMDALKDDSDLYNVEYIIKNLGAYSKRLSILYYYSKVDHPMSNIYRNAATDITKEITNHMWSKIGGAKVTNEFTISNTQIKAGVEYSRRTWLGKYYNNGKFTGYSINNAVTKNKGVFIDTTTKIGANTLRAGVRYDDTEITNDGGYLDRDFNALSGYIFNTYALSSSLDIFGGVGVSHRVPDGRELYFWKKGKLIGTPTLNKTRNIEFDIGMKKSFESGAVKAKVFYSKLKDYIYFHQGKTENVFENVDAKIYGIELSGSYLFGDKLSLEGGITFQRGLKDEPLAGQSDRDLADIAPLRANLIANYFYDEKTTLSLELIGQKRWTHYDSDNGEQEIPGFVVANFKLKREVTPNLEFTFGVDNIFDKTYAQSNTYSDLTLIMSGAKQKVKLNEPGRYIYMNLSYKF